LHKLFERRLVQNLVIRYK